MIASRRFPAAGLLVSMCFGINIEWPGSSRHTMRFTKMAFYKACVISTLLYGSETWTTYAGQERRLNTFDLRSIRRILGICWQDKVANADVLSRAGLPTMYTLLDNAYCDGWVMSVVWRMVAFQNTSSTGSWLWGSEPPAALTCDIDMSA